MTISMMAGVTVTSFLIYYNIEKHYTMAIPLVVMKFTSALMGLSFFICGCIQPETGWNTLANVIICFTDLPLGLFMLFCYVKVRMVFS